MVLVCKALTFIAGQHIIGSKWKEATSVTRQPSKAAIQELMKHRKEHGC